MNLMHLIILLLIGGVIGWGAFIVIIGEYCYIRRRVTKIVLDLKKELKIFRKEIERKKD